ncbi:S8 family serine peptidase [uncultured Prevotella sp.]|uniref:S8 family serine peptidase n=1 Tax=uncultured Prevotella sp. TaxID=159272 RepID=UPI00258AA378|nr:S8 family serine peptidase [uncultured Prevotella sp.]
MKKSLITCALLCLSATAVIAQSSDNEDNVVKISESMHRAHRPGQVLVKFKDDSSISIKKQAPGRMRVSSQRVQSVLNQLGVTNMEQLMPIGGKVKMKPSERLRRANGKMMEDRDLSKLYLVDFNVHRIPSVQNAIEALQELEEVEFAEPNYLVYALGTPAETAYIPKARRTVAPAAFTPNDPMYEQQWGPAAINLPQFWATETQNVLGRRPVIAILDTGVDINHPDLKDNIWTNENELNGVEGEDDDLNGYKDDLHGWDCVNQTGRIGDWNGHGTHCAGIAAAVEGNGIGVVGANPDALIMPVTVLQSDGIGDVGTIIRGIEYTMKHQVDVISMSIGGYGYSIAYELALGKAYNRSVIVAAAGNDGLCIYPGHSCCSKPMFPGAFTFVLGVEASKDYAGTCFSACGRGVSPYNANPWRACFSNLDDDGPIYTDLNIFDEEKLYNYELLVPGTNIMSTYPGGRYKFMNGTSMATPLAAGAISRLLETKEYSSKELLFGDLIGSANNSSKVMDVMAAYNLTDVDRKPTLMLVGYTMKDSVGGDNDKRFDAGEIIELYPIMRNSWGEAIGIKCSLTTSENEDPEIIEILDNNVDFGRTLHSYGKEQSVNPIRFKINDNCVDGRHIRLTINSTCENGTGETIAQDIIITAENGEELNGIMQKNTTLVAGKHYIINKSFAIPANLTLTLQPGTTLKIHDGAQLIVSDQGRIRAIGTADEPITITKGDLSQGYVPTLKFNNNCVFQYCQFVMLSAEVNLFSGGKFTDCIFKDCYVGDEGITGINTTRCNIIQNTGYAGIGYGNTHKNSNIIDNTITTRTGTCQHGCPWFYFLPGYKEFNGCNLYGNSIDFLKCYADIVYIDLEPTVIYTDYPSYFGSTKEETVRKRVLDYYHEYNDDVHYTSFGAVDLKNMLKEPNSQAHGIVWKILVDGKDAQDEYDMIPPLGVGTHRVDVYFNREMDTLVAPYLAMGVRPPYTQNFINENPSWSEDGKIYTAYITITAKSAFDGINRFYVADAQDQDHFVIPVERSRFNVPVSAAGSKSVGFMAEPGLGKVNLTWMAIDTVDVEDVIGYNVYRYTMDDQLVASDTLRVNEELIMLDDGIYEGELSFTDYDVTPGTTYYYYYRALRSTLDSTEPSLTVAATPATSTKGDANGSMDVTVADVVSEIDYLTDQNPKPFIFEAADVNSDEIINILDVVGTINIIMGNPTSSRLQALSTAEYTIEDGLLYIDSPVQLAGLQVLFQNEDDEPCCEPLEILKGMEYASCMKDENYLFMSYSFRGRTIPAGRHAILRVGDAEVSGIVLSDVNGHEVMANYSLPTIIENILPEQQVETQKGLFDLMGRKIQTMRKGVYVIDGKKVCY